MVSVFSEVVTHGGEATKAIQMAQSIVRLVLVAGCVEYESVY